VHQAGELITAIEAAGGTAVAFPAIEVQGRNAAVVREEDASLPPADIVIFTSPNAVDFGLHAVAEDGVRIAAIGPSTQAALERAGRSVDIRSESGFDSEHLLAHPELRSVRGKRVRIVRGDTGRRLLAEALRERGATVDYLSVYRRLPARPSPAALADIERTWRSGGIDCVTVMSVETLEHLLSILPDFCRDALNATILVTPSRRVIQTAAEKIPAAQTTLAPGPQAADMLRALIACRNKTGKPK
jgi:uroporphyrinogen-III synthase